MKKGRLYIIAACSGTGKTSLVNALLEQTEDIKLSVSHTTRPRRPSEEDSKSYFYVDEAKFTSMIEENLFLEHAKVYGNYYGTSRNWVEKELSLGLDVILEIDWQGARQIRQLWPQVISIFILPPSLEILRQRLKIRAQDSHDVIEQRMAQACSEMSHYGEYDYLIINDDFSKALHDLIVIVTAERLRQPVQAAKYRDLIERLVN